MKLICILSFVLFSNTSLASTRLSSLCKQASSEKDKLITQQEKSFSISDIIKLIFHAEKYVGFVETNDSNLNRKKTSRWSGHVLLPRMISIREGALEAAFENAKWSYVKLNRNIQVLLRTASYEDCLEEAKTIGLSEESLKQYEEIRRTYLKLKSISDGNEIHKAGRTFADQSKYFEFATAGSQSEMLDEIEKLRKKTNSVVLILHASKGGILTDFEGYAIPPLFFQKIKNYEIENLIIYSCHPIQVQQFYQQSFKELNTFGTRIFLPKLEGPLANLAATPLSLLPTFLKQVTHFIAQ